MATGNGTIEQGAIEKVAVVGAGVMGAAIAAHVANAGVPVVLLDIVPDGANNRNALAEGAVECPCGLGVAGRGVAPVCGFAWLDNAAGVVTLACDGRDQK